MINCKMKNNSISLISGECVPYNVSYFPSVIPQDDIILQNYTPTSSQNLSTLAAYPHENQFERGTQTSFRYVPMKDRKNIYTPPSGSASVMEDSGPSFTAKIYPPSEPMKEIDNCLATSLKVGSPLTRSASYEKAILSSMKERDNEVERSLRRNTSPTSSKTSVSFKKGKRSFDFGTSSTSSVRSLSLGFPSVAEIFHNGRGTFERWKKRTSLRKLSVPNGEDREMKLLKHEHFHFSPASLNEEDKTRSKVNKFNGEDFQGDSIKTEGEYNSNDESFETDIRSAGDSSTLPLRTETLTTLTKSLDDQLPTTKDQSSIVVLNVIEKHPKKDKDPKGNGTSPKVGDLEKKSRSKIKHKDLIKQETVHTTRSLEVLQKSYSCYPEGGGGGSEYPYLREMKERLLITKDAPIDTMDDPSRIDTENQLLEVHQTPVGTVVKLNADGYGSHTSPTHRVESFYTGTLESRKTNVHEFFPKNAKTSSFITLSLLYATLLVVVCLGFVLSEVLTHNVPLYYYEAFFTYLYGISIFFLLYIFCYLLSDSSREGKTPKNQVFMVRLSMLCPKP